MGGENIINVCFAFKPKQLIITKKLEIIIVSMKFSTPVCLAYWNQYHKNKFFNSFLIFTVFYEYRYRPSIGIVSIKNLVSVSSIGIEIFKN